MKSETFHKAEITETKDLSKNVLQYTLDVFSEGFQWNPGQYLFIRTDQNTNGNPFSIASAPNSKQPGRFQVAMNKERNAEFARKLHLESIIEVSEPAGGLHQNLVDTNTLFVATGTGASPFRAILQSLFKPFHKVKSNITLLFGCKNQEEILWNDEFQKWSQEQESFNFFPIISQPLPHWIGKQGRVQEYINTVVHEVLPQQILLCGHSDMIQDTRKVLDDLNFPQAKVFDDQNNS